MTVIREYRHVSSPLEVRSSRHIVGSFVLAVLLLSVLFGIGGFMFAGWRTWWPNAIERYTALPAASLEGRMLWYPSVAMLARGLSASDGETVPSEDDYRSAFSLGLRRLRIDALADEFDVEVTDEEVEAAYDASDDGVQTFLETSGWTTEEYKKHVLRPFVLAQKTETAVRRSEKYQEKALAELADLKKKVEMGIQFTDVATQYSEHGSAKSGGSMGYVLPGEVDPGFADAFKLQVGEVSDVLETESEYWIVKVEDIAVTEDNRYFLLGIAVKKDNLATIVDGLMERAQPIIFVQ